MRKVLKRLCVFLLILGLLISTVFCAIITYGTMTRPVNHVESIEKYAQEYDVDPLLVLSVIKVESNFNSDAVSHMNAKGLMQIIPETGKWIAQKLGVQYSDDMLHDSETNIKMGTYYLSYLLQHFGNRDLAIAAYNGGIGNVKQWLLDKRYSDDQKILKDIPLDETRNYVKKVNSNYDIYRIFYKGIPLRNEMQKDFSTIIGNIGRSFKAIRKSY